LLACVCCRHGWDLLIDGRSREAVETGERYADGHASDLKRGQAYQAAMAAAEEMFKRAAGTYDTEDELHATHAATTTVLTNHRLQLFGGLAHWDEVVYLGRYRAGRKLWEQLPPTENVAPHFLRDILGNPFRPPAPDPGWLTPNAQAVAQLVYETRAFDELPILADALVDAGCDDQAILAHCRSEGLHVRGCWVLDLILPQQAPKK
jgi:hypothetical protein